MILGGPEILGRLEAEGILPQEGGGARVDLLARFAGEVALWGSRTHLVGRSNRERNILVSLLDSMHLLRMAERSGILGAHGRRVRVADIGAGAGFPGMIWAIARTDTEITLFERRGKPRLFLERTAKLLGLAERVAVEGDAEPSDRREEYDIVVSKAAGRLVVIIPIAVGLLRRGGAYMTIKGKNWEEELQEAGSMNLESVEPLPGNRGSMLALRKE